LAIFGLGSELPTTHPESGFVHLKYKNGASAVLDFSISSRAFKSGFEIKTPIGNFSANKVRLSPTGEFHIIDDSGNQIARLETEGFFSSVYNIIITGGGGYQFGRSADSSHQWACKGEGKLYRISEKEKRRFELSAETPIAECSKAPMFNDYQIRVFNDVDLKLAICVFIALSLLEYQSDAGIPD